MTTQSLTDIAAELSALVGVAPAARPVVSIEEAFAALLAGTSPGAKPAYAIRCTRTGEPVEPWAARWDLGGIEVVAG